MSSNTPSPTTRTGAAASTAPRRQTAVRRAPTSARLAREARQQRLAYLALFGIIGLVVVILVGGALWEYVIAPAQPVATVNGTVIRTDTFNRYQGFQKLLLTSQLNQISSELQQLQSNPKLAAADAQLTTQLTAQQTTIQTNLTSNIQATTLSAMEAALEVQRAAARIGVVPTQAQLDALLVKQVGGGSAAGLNRVLGNAGVQRSDVRTYYAAPAAIQQTLTARYQAALPKPKVTVSPTQPEAKARHILVKLKVKADQLAQAIRSGAPFAPLAKKYSIDTSSAVVGGWLRDPVIPAGTPSRKTPNAVPANQPTWLTPQTGFVAPVLNAVLAMKPGEVRVVQSQFGYHVIQVTAHQTLVLTKAQIQQQRQQQLQQLQQQQQQQVQTKYQTWYTSATSPASNKIVPPDPNAQFPPSTPTGQ